MKNILHNLFQGQLPKWTHDPSITEKSKEIKQTIERERQYFSGILSAEDFKRFEKLDRLYRRKNAIQSMNAYINAFRTGAMIILAVLMEGDLEQ